MAQYERNVCMDNYHLAKLMRVEKACVKRGSTCNRECAECDLVQDDKALIAAYNAVIKMLEDPQQRRVVFCCQCEHWDKESGLTARKCMKHEHVTVQFNYCSDGREMK